MNTPKELMNAMLNNEEVNKYKVSEKSIWESAARNLVKMQELAGAMSTRDDVDYDLEKERMEWVAESQLDR